MHSPNSDGIFEYAHTKNYLKWFSPKWKCSTDIVGAYGGNAIDLRISNEAKVNGAWCDIMKDQQRKFICESININC